MKLKQLLLTLCVCLVTFVAATAHADDFNPLGPVRLGVLGGIGLPSPVSAQLLFKYKEIVGANLELGMLPEVTVPVGDSVKVHQEMIDLSVRFYPFKGAFFLACGIGSQSLTVTGKAMRNGVTGDADVKVSTVFVSPRLGFIHKFTFGLAIGMDLGVEIPINGNIKTDASIAGVAVNVPQEALDVANKIKTTPIPIIHLLQLGYIF